MKQVFDLDELAEAWMAPIVRRGDVGIFSGGFLNPRTLANLDSLGKGPGKIVIGGRVCYSTKDLVAWMKQRQNTH